MTKYDLNKSHGLAGVTVSDTSICLCDPHTHKLLYRGYPIEQLVKECSFEEVVWLLLHKDLPSKEELAGLTNDLIMLRDPSPSMKKFLEQLPPTVNLMDVLRSAVSVLGHLHPELEEIDPFLIAERAISSLGSILLYWYFFHTENRKITTKTEKSSLAAHFLTLLHEKLPSEKAIRALDYSLILYAEHEFNASTFTVRTIASTLSDYYSSICGGISALRGPLHGAANEAALKLILSYRSPQAASQGILEKLKSKEKIMGFGHRVYKTEDPRSTLIYKKAKELVEHPQQEALLKIAETIEEVMREEKGLFPNLDFYSALTYHFLNIPSFFFTPLFVMSRISGWTAHYYEQKANNKLIRPNSHYVGPSERVVKPLSERNG